MGGFKSDSVFNLCCEKTKAGRYPKYFEGLSYCSPVLNVTLPHTTHTNVEPHQFWSEMNVADFTFLKHSK